jgi:DNA repair protein RecN (Recombination protein N)
MLQTLTISNFALIEQMQVDWTAGLNVLIGETGAGKSILIDALSILLGAKAGPSIIRAGTEKCYLEGIFKPTESVCAQLREAELVDESVSELVVSREVTKSGSRFRVNGTLVNQTLVQELRQRLISIHAQHEARTLLSSQSQLELLDSLGDKEHTRLVADVRLLYERNRDLSNQLNEFQISEEERLRRLDFARFQLTELTDARLVEEDEDENLVTQEVVLANVSLLDSNVATAQEALNGEVRPDGGGESTVLDLLQKALSTLQKSSRFDPKLEPLIQNLQGSLVNLEECSTELRRYREGLDTDPETLNAVQTRLGQLSAIKRKYGPSLKDAIRQRDALLAELARLEGASASAEQLMTELQETKEKLKEIAQQLSSGRARLSKRLCVQVKSELSDLGMERCQFEIAIEEQEEIGPGGAERIEFMIAPNPGQPLAPLAKIASGGELSRVMLAIKSIFAAVDQIPTVVFDEIDTGLSGKTLQSMRDKLAYLAKSHQILCITHQPIIAAVADNHLQIEKEHQEHSTHVSAKVLNEEESLKALASMASGNEDEEVALTFAKSLVEQAKGVRHAQS